MEEKELKKIIRKKLNILEIPANLIGYRYLVEALYYSIMHELSSNENQSNANKIYEHVAIKKKTNYKAVERNISTAVSYSTIKRNNNLSIKITNLNFIARVTYEILDEIS